MQSLEELYNIIYGAFASHNLSPSIGMAKEIKTLFEIQFRHGGGCGLKQATTLVGAEYELNVRGRK